MGLPLWLLAGLGLGLAGALPGRLLATRARDGRAVSVALGLQAVILSFIFLSAALFIGYLLLPEGFLSFALVLVGAFLGSWMLEVWRSWRWMHPWV